MPQTITVLEFMKFCNIEILSTVFICVFVLQFYEDFVKELMQESLKTCIKSDIMDFLTISLNSVVSRLTESQKDEVEITELIVNINEENKQKYTDKITEIIKKTISRR